MRIVRSILFMKSCGSWSSGLPVKNVVVVSVISSSSNLATGLRSGGLCRTGGVTCPNSLGVQAAGEKVNRDDSEEESVIVSYDPSESSIDVILPAGGRYWSLISDSVMANDWPLVSVDHGSELCS